MDRAAIRFVCIILLHMTTFSLLGCAKNRPASGDILINTDRLQITFHVRGEHASPKFDEDLRMTISGVGITVTNGVAAIRFPDASVLLITIPAIEEVIDTHNKPGIEDLANVTIAWLLESSRIAAVFERIAQAATEEDLLSPADPASRRLIGTLFRGARPLEMSGTSAVIGDFEGSVDPRPEYLNRLKELYP